jgi:hypothetical protein
MSAPTAVAAKSYFRRGWIHVLTLALVTINYMDRSALGIVARSVILPASLPAPRGA